MWKSIQNQMGALSSTIAKKCRSPCCMKGSDSVYSMVLNNQAAENASREGKNCDWIQRLLDMDVEVKSSSSSNSTTTDSNNNNNDNNLENSCVPTLRLSGPEVALLFKAVPQTPGNSAADLSDIKPYAQLNDQDSGSTNFSIPEANCQEANGGLQAQISLPSSVSSNLVNLPQVQEAREEATIDLSSIKILDPSKISYMVANKAGIYSNGRLEVLFDTLTPRPHLIVKFKRDEENKRNLWNKNPINKSILEFDEDELRELIQFVLEFQVNYLKELMKDGGKQLILSFHTGHWASTKEFHCHLCMDMDMYLKLFSKFRIIGPISPSSKWEITNPLLNTKQLYIENVKNFENVKIRSSQDYKNQEIDLINNNNNGNDGDQSNGHDDKKYLEQFQQTNPDVYISFDSTEPKLKFKLDKPCDYMNLVRKLCKYADDNGYFMKPNGCHVCVKITDPFEPSTTTTEGYLHMPADQYHRIHPLPLVFLEKFMQKEDYCIST